MKILRLQGENLSIDFELAKGIADHAARLILGENLCLAWYDKARDQASPSNVNECHDQCEVPGYEEYAVHRGAELKVLVGAGDFVFFYIPLGEFADV
jgi:hypothetical protein